MTYNKIKDISCERYNIKVENKPRDKEQYGKWWLEKKERIKLKKSIKNLKSTNLHLKSPGVPDFFYKTYDTSIKKKRNIFVEIKADNDGLRYNQLKWICKHRGIKIRIIWFTLEYC